MHSSKLLHSPKAVAYLTFHVSFGLGLLLVGVYHYMQMAELQGMITANMGALAPVAQIWAYILPALMIVGGLSFLTRLFPVVGAWAAGVALGSIAVGMLLKTVIGGATLGTMMQPAVTAYIWLLIYFVAVKSFKKCGCGSHASCNCGSKDCHACNDKKM